MYVMYVYVVFMYVIHLQQKHGPQPQGPRTCGITCSESGALDCSCSLGILPWPIYIYIYIYISTHIRPISQSQPISILGGSLSEVLELHEPPESLEEIKQWAAQASLSDAVEDEDTVNRQIEVLQRRQDILVSKRRRLSGT